MKPRTPRSPIALSTIAALPLLLCPLAPAQAWSGALQDGSKIQVDPNTHRAFQLDGTVARPLWDGVHRLEDGSIVIIRGGTAVPTQDMLHSWQGPVATVDALEGRPCEQLERRVCGRDNSCRASAACLNARSLLNSEREAQRRAPFGAGARPTTEFTKRCEEALTDPEFPPCLTAATGTGPCARLVEQACGEADRCATSPACPPARQLLSQETEERSAIDHPDALTPSGAQCQEALDNPFFRPCE